MPSEQPNVDREIMATMTAKVGGANAIVAAAATSSSAMSASATPQRAPGPRRAVARLFGVLPIGLDVAPVIKDIDRAGEQTEKAQAAHRTAEVCRFRNRKKSNGRAKPFFTHCRMRSRTTADLTTFQPNTPLSSDCKVVIGGPKRQCHDGRLRIYAGRTRQHAAVRHDDIVEAS